MAIDQRLIDALRATAEIYGRQLSAGAAAMFMADLSKYSTDEVLVALQRCRSELRTFPTVADIATRVGDSRPGPEEAWAMIPKDEEASVIWTDEMAEAYGVARSLLNEGDSVGARMAFRESYSRLVEEARRLGRRVKWTASFGFDKEMRNAAISFAVQRGYLTAPEAQALLPDYSERVPDKTLQLTGPVERSPEATEVLAKIRDILKPMPKPNSAPAPIKNLTREETERLKREQIMALKSAEGLL